MNITRTTRAVALAATLVLVTLSGCGSSDAGDGDASGLPSIEDSTGEADVADEPSDDAGAEKDPELAMADFEKCMRDNGIELQVAGDGSGTMSQTVEVPDDGSGDASMEFTDPADFEQIADTCSEESGLSFGDLDDLSPEEQAEMADRNLAFQQCLAEQGFEIDMQDGAFQLGPEIDFDEFDAAADECGMNMTGPSGGSGENG